MRNWRRGFTLLETLVALAILAVFAAGALMALGGSAESEARARRASEIHDAQKDLLTRLAGHGAPLPTESEGATSSGMRWEITVIEEQTTSDAPGAPRLQTLSLLVTPAGEPTGSVEPLVTRHFGVGQARPL